MTSDGVFTASVSGSYVVTATSVEDPRASGQLTVLATCTFPNVAVAGDNRTSTYTEARAQVVSGGMLLVNEVDRGGASSTVPAASGMGYSYAASASGSGQSVTARTSSTVVEPLSVSASAEAERVIRIAAISGLGTGRVRLTGTISGQTGDDGLMFARLEFDPYDDVGRDDVRFERPFGSGPSSFSQTLTLDEPFSYSIGPTALYARLALQLSQNANATLTLTSSTVTLEGCQ